MTQLSGAHAFRQFIRQFCTDLLEILFMTFPSYVLIIFNISKVGPFYM